MPPRYAYWTILVDGQPTAFRAAMEEDLMPTFKRLQQKHPSAEMKWFQNGKLWGSRVEAQEAMQMRGDRGRIGDERQGGGFRDRKRSSRTVGENFSSPKEERSEDGKLDWKPKGEFTPAPRREDRGERGDWKSKKSFDRDRKPAWKPKSSSDRDRKRPSRPGGENFSSPEKEGRGDDGNLDWKPKGEFTPAPKRADRADRGDWKSKKSFDRERKPAWKPKGSLDRDRKRSSRPVGENFSSPGDERSDNGKLDWKPKGEFTPAPKRADREEWKPNRSSRPGGGRDWTPKSGYTGPKPEGAPEKRKWIPKEEYKKSKGIEARRDKNWRPGGEHKDPRQKYKDAKKAKWSKFKANIRQRWDAKGGKPPRRTPKGDGPPKKRRDEE